VNNKTRKVELLSGDFIDYHIGEDEDGFEGYTSYEVTEEEFKRLKDLKNKILSLSKEYNKLMSDIEYR